ncbi:UDP-N-acetylmuramyl tripeptide synthase [Nannocystis exedens]|uniref:UDP-N-acetylmuramyl tripeptide synthase n=1 Tax=Nannocystis exedens TaxID=54 RepID=A0A1I2AE47_9BACT|nr:Mur ligase family protein [Nannocystis exedens]PCC69779.1 Cyanophycin synthetase [Nannocystis exedens]SFE41997.1 UDP-N-acetylmuramyl tripeptide synthase [Nannocystis exedens]
MRLLDARRLTGVNLDLDGPGAIAEVEFEAGDDVARAIAVWQDAVARAARLLGWDAPPAVRRWTGDRGAALVFPAPADALYVAVDVTEWAVECAQRALAGEPARELDELAPTLLAARERERLPVLSALHAAAEARGVPLLLDDDHLSLGEGARSRTWPRALAPAPADVPWDSLRPIPVALITGTNGKTTTARLLARIARTAGHVPGNTSTDGLAVAEQVVETGDWTGPGAARIVLRDPRVTLAVLEVARGGILRRGLAVDRCDAACITNVSADHLGEHGIDDLAAMARVKAVVTRVVAPHGRIVLGADAPIAVPAPSGMSSSTLPSAQVLSNMPKEASASPVSSATPQPNPLLDLPAAAFPAPVVWFSRDPQHPQLVRHRAAGGEVWFVSAAGQLTRGRGGEPDVAVVALDELPFCFGGAATHNVANALAAAALAAALGLPDPAIAAGLRSFVDNPGRAQLVRLDHAKLFLDFAHNPAGIAGLAPLLAQIRAGARLLVSLGIAGDRRDDDIRDIARAVASLGPDLVLTRDLEHYLRGRAPGEVPALLEHSFAGLGIACERVESEVAAIRRGLEWARPGDVIAILVHVDRDEVWAELRARGVAPEAGQDRSGRPGQA